MPPQVADGSLSMSPLSTAAGTPVGIEHHAIRDQGRGSENLDSFPGYGDDDEDDDYDDDDDDDDDGDDDGHTGQLRLSYDEVQEQQDQQKAHSDAVCGDNGKNPDAEVIDDYEDHDGSHDCDCNEMVLTVMETAAASDGDGDDDDDHDHDDDGDVDVWDIAPNNIRVVNRNRLPAVMWF